MFTPETLLKLGWKQKDTNNSSGWFYASANISVMSYHKANSLHAHYSLNTHSYIHEGAQGNWHWACEIEMESHSTSFSTPEFKIIIGTEIRNHISPSFFHHSLFLVCSSSFEQYSCYKWQTGCVQWPFIHLEFNGWERRGCPVSSVFGRSA